MSLFILLLIFSLSLTQISAKKSRFCDKISSFSEEKKCSNELAAIVYTPPLYAYDYLKRVNEKLKALSSVIWNNPNEARYIVKTFQRSNSVSVLFYDALGQIAKYPGGPASPGEDDSYVIMRTYGIGEGFDYIIPANPDRGIYFYKYASIYWNPKNNGEMYTVLLYTDARKFATTAF